MPDPVAVRSMFGRVAGRYDLANRVLSGGIDVRWRRRLVRAVHDCHPHDVLDLATGSGDVAFALAEGLRPGTRIIGADFCEPMLDEARLKQEKRPARGKIDFVVGDGMSLPFPDRSFDAVTVAFGLRNMADRGKALGEMRRVLRPAGRLFVLEFSQPYGWFAPLYYVYLLRVSPRLAGALTGERSAYEYLGGSIEQFPNRAGLSDEIRAAGFAWVRATALTFGIVALHEAAAPADPAPVS